LRLEATDASGALSLGALSRGRLTERVRGKFPARLPVAQYCGIEVLGGRVSLQSDIVGDGHVDAAVPEHLADDLVLPGVLPQEIPGREVACQMHVEPDADGLGDSGGEPF